MFWNFNSLVALLKNFCRTVQPCATHSQCITAPLLGVPLSWMLDMIDSYTSWISQMSTWTWAITEYWTIWCSNQHVPWNTVSTTPALHQLWWLCSMAWWHPFRTWSATIYRLKCHDAPCSCSWRRFSSFVPLLSCVSRSGARSLDRRAPRLRFSGLGGGCYQAIEFMRQTAQMPGSDQAVSLEQRFLPPRKLWRLHNIFNRSLDAGLCNRHLLMCCLATISTLSLASEVCLLIGHQQKLQLSTNNFHYLFIWWKGLVPPDAQESCPVSFVCLDCWICFATLQGSHPVPHPADGASARHLQAGRAVHSNNRCFGVFCVFFHIF